MLWVFQSTNQSKGVGARGVSSGGQVVFGGLPNTSIHPILFPSGGLFSSDQGEKAVGYHPKKGTPSIAIRQEYALCMSVMFSPER
jgi:hypothetical protein